MNGIKTEVLGTAATGLVLETRVSALASKTSLVSLEDVVRDKGGVGNPKGKTTDSKTKPDPSQSSQPLVGGPIRKQL